MHDKKGMELEMLGWLLIAAFVLVLLMVGIAIFTGRGNAIIDYIRHAIKFK